MTLLRSLKQCKGLSTDALREYESTFIVSVMYNSNNTAVIQQEFMNMKQMMLLQYKDQTSYVKETLYNPTKPGTSRMGLF